MKKAKARYKFPLQIASLPRWKSAESVAAIAARTAELDDEAARSVPPPRAAGRYPTSIVGLLVREEMERGWQGGEFWKAGASIARVRLGLFKAGELESPEDRSMDDTIRKTRQREEKEAWSRHEDRRR